MTDADRVARLLVTLREFAAVHIGATLGREQLRDLIGYLDRLDARALRAEQVLPRREEERSR